jgi:hypothetical protein
VQHEARVGAEKSMQRDAIVRACHTGAGRYLWFQNLTFILPPRSHFRLMDTFYALITLICIIAGVAAVILAFTKPRYLAAFCFAALGVLLAIPVAHSLGSGDQRQQLSVGEPVQRFASGDVVPASSSRDRSGSSEGTRSEGDSPRAVGTPSAASRRDNSPREGEPIASRGYRGNADESERAEPPLETAAPQRSGSTSVSVSGDVDSAARNEAASALMEALRSRGWAGLSTGGRKRLVLIVSVKDAGLLLGQLNAASVSLQWRLVSASGDELGSGGVADVRGRGLDEVDARSNAIQRAASQAADQIVSG